MDASPPPFVPFVGRLAAAMCLRPAAYTAIANDTGAGSLAAAVVSISAMVQPSAVTEELGSWGLLLLLLFGILRWYLFTTLVYPIARLVAGKPIEYRRLLRCLGFAEAPAVINAAAPYALTFEPLLRLVVGLWLLAATIVAVRAALDVKTGRAVAVGLLGFALYLSLRWFGPSS